MLWMLATHGSLFPCLPTKPLLGWVYTMKIKPDGTIDRYKARLVAQGYIQIFCPHYGNTFSLVAEITFVCPFSCHDTHPPLISSPDFIVSKDSRFIYRLKCLLYLACASILLYMLMAISSLVMTLSAFFNSNLTFIVNFRPRTWVHLSACLASKLHNPHLALPFPSRNMLTKSMKSFFIHHICNKHDSWFICSISRMSVKYMIC